jgi:sensor histidine kinase regulating citrate/malate metabolism
MKLVLTQYSGTIVLVVALIVLLGLYLSWTATRLDRLHIRLDAARIALDAQLLRRSAAVLELARSGLLDVATALLLTTAAREAQVVGETEREAVESALTRDLRAVFADPQQVAEVRAIPEGAELLDELSSAMRRVQLARRFHNESVRAVRLLRSNRRVRYFRLAGRAPDKATFEIADEVPAALLAR